MAFGHEMPIDASLLPSAARLTAFGSDIETNGGTLPDQPVSLILLWHLPANSQVLRTVFGQD